MKSKFTRRQVLGGMALVLGASATGYGFLLEPRRLSIERVEVMLQRLPPQFDGFRIAQLSDIHYGPYMSSEFVREAVQEIDRLRPDLVVLTGDFVSHPLGKSPGIEGARFVVPCAEALQGLRGKYQAVAILGNHDHWNDPETVRDGLEAAGFPVLRNQAIPLQREGARLWIVGLDDALVRTADLEQALRGIPPAEAAVVLVHEPDFADYTARFPVDLQLSGHSHGGQVRLPWLGAPVLPRMAEKYPMGLYRLGSLQLYTNRGLGVINPPVRCNCPPEITLVTLHAAV